MDGPAGQDAVAPMELTPTEQQLLEHIRAGLVDAEIAVRMGISNGDVKARVERLIAKLGVDGREALRQGQPGADAPPPQAPFNEERQVERVPASIPRLSLLIAACLIFAAGLAAGLWLSNDATATPDRSLAVTGTPSSPVPTATAVLATQTPEARIETIDGRDDMASAGRLFFSGGGEAVVESSIRESVAVVRLYGPGYMALNGETEWSAGGGGYVLNGMVGGVNFDVFYQAGDRSTQFLVGPGDYIGVYSTEPEQRPVVLLYAIGPGGRRHHLYVASSGDLYIELSPIPATPSLDSATGEALDTSGTQAAGQLPIELSAWAFSVCEPGPCVVSRQTRSPGEGAPVPGRVVCPDEDFAIPPGWQSDFTSRAGQVLTLDAGEFRLHFWRQVGAVNGVDPGKLHCPPTGEVAVGEPLLPPGHYLVFASSPSGQPLDVVVDGLGHLSVGKIERQFGCPCVSGS